MSETPALAKRVLVVEDEALLAEALRAWLENAGYEVCGLAVGARDALELALAHRPDLVVMDVRLADGDDGVAAARELERRAGTPALFFTAHPEAVKAGRIGLGHVVKPAGEREFLAAVGAAFAIAADAVPLHPPAALHLRAPAGAPNAARPPHDAALRAVVQSAPHGVVLVDRELRLLQVNPACARLFRLQAAALVGRPLAALPCADAALTAAVRACLAGERDDVPARETVLVGHNGRPLYARLSGTVLRDPRGAAPMVLLHVQDLSELREAERAARYFGLFDYCTGLVSRDLFYERLDRARARAARMGTPFAVLLIDLDRFDDFVAAHGVEAGDAVVVAIADRIDDRRREVDTAARLGGNLFAVLLEGPTRAGAVRMARELAALIRLPVEVGEVALRVTACIGLVWCGDPRVSLPAIVERAEAALARAQRRGVDEVVEASP